MENKKVKFQFCIYLVILFTLLFKQQLFSQICFENPYEINGGVIPDFQVVDVNNDGYKDLIIPVHIWGDAKIIWYQNDGNGIFSPIDTICIADRIKFFHSCDFDCDGDVDVVAGLEFSSYFRVNYYQNNGSGEFTYVKQIYNSRGDFACSGDLNGDGNEDLILRTWDNLQWYSIENGTFGNPNYFVSQVDVFIAVDLDNDLDVDVLGGRGNEIVWYENSNNGSVFTEHLISDQMNNISSLDYYDINGDSYKDILISNYGNHKFVYLLNEGSTSFSNPVEVYSKYHPKCIHAADIDNDGDCDVLCGSTYGTRVLFNDGNESFNDYFDIDGYMSYVSTFDGDYDGDLDIFISSTTSGHITMYEQNPIPEIIEHPVDTSINSNENITFSVVANKTCYYQWMVDQGAGYINLVNDQTYHHIDEPTLIIKNVMADMTGYKYKCLLYNSDNQTTSEEAELTVNTAIKKHWSRKIKIYPNPTNDVIIIQTDGNYQNVTDFSIRIINTLGQTIFKNMVNIQLFTVDISAFGVSGIYYLQITDETGQIVEVRKIILN